MLIDAAEFAEVIFRRGEEALQFCAENDSAAMHLVSTRGALPEDRTPTDRGGHRAVAAGVRPRRGLFAEAQGARTALGRGRAGHYPVTTDLDRAGAAGRGGARRAVLRRVPVEIDATARNAIGAQSLTGDDSDELRDALPRRPRADRLATERHIAALAAEIGAQIRRPAALGAPHELEAAVLLTLAATRMLAMKRDVELAWRSTRSARTGRAAREADRARGQAASLSIIESLDEISVELLTEWLETGSRGSSITSRSSGDCGGMQELRRARQELEGTGPLERFLESCREAERVPEFTVSCTRWRKVMSRRSLWSRCRSRHCWFSAPPLG